MKKKPNQINFILSQNFLFHFKKCYIKHKLIKMFLITQIRKEKKEKKRKIFHIFFFTFRDFFLFDIDLYSMILTYFFGKLSQFKNLFPKIAKKNFGKFLKFFLTFLLFQTLLVVLFDISDHSLRIFF